MARMALGRRHGYDPNSIKEPFACMFYDLRHRVDCFVEGCEVDDVQQQVRALQVAQELVSQARALGRALVHPRVMIGSDGSALAPSGEMSGGTPHPRSYGTFPRVLGVYTREERLLALSHAVHKMTGLPASRLGLRDRGVLRVGARADIVVFDARRVADVATYESPHRYPDGIEYVIVNGRLVIKGGQHTGSLPGRVLAPS